MEVTWYGQALFKLKGKNSTVVMDPYEADFVGFKVPKDLVADTVLISHSHQDHNNADLVSGSPMVFAGPGEYEVKDVVITGISSFHDNEGGRERGLNTIYQIIMDGLNIVHLGDLGQFKLTEEQVTQIGQVDILMIPVGGIYTINSKQAAEIVAQLEPKIIIPMHYGVEGLKFPLEGVDKFLKEMGAENVTPQAKLTITKEKLPAEPMVVVLSKG